MIKIYIELWPGGDENNRRLIASGEIWNDGSGDLKIGNYEGILRDHLIDENGKPYEDVYLANEVKNFKRLKYNVWDLLKKFLKKGNIKDEFNFKDYGQEYYDNQWK